MADWKTRLIHTGSRVPQGFHALAEPTHRGSTVLFDNVASILDEADPYDEGFSYGLRGTPTTLELAVRICELEGGYRTVIAPGGLAALSLVDLAFLKAGDHVLLPVNVYGPNQDLATGLLERFGVSYSLYEPGVGAGIAALIEPNTRLIWTETPGSITMEVPDIPAIVAAAHERGVLVALDNTWAAGVYFDAFKYGVDIAVQALTKYVGGHSDVLLGSVTVRSKELWPPLGKTHGLLGNGVSPDEAQLALRGIKTMAVRLAHIEKSALELAQWLTLRPEVERVLHPALQSCPGHEIWKRDFTGASGVFTLVFRDTCTRAQIAAFVDALKLFGLGYSWGGVASVVMTYDFSRHPERTPYGFRMVRLSVGLEETADLKSDLDQAFGKMAK